MISVMRITAQLKPGYENGKAVNVLGSTGRIANCMHDVLNIVHPSFTQEQAFDYAGDAAQDRLTQSLDVGEALDFKRGHTTLHDRISMGYTEGSGLDTIFLIGGSFGNDVALLQTFYGSLFGLAVIEVEAIKEYGWLSFFVIKMPPFSSEPFPAVAVMATYEDGWGPDAYNLPAARRDRIIETARPLLSTTL